MDTPISTCAKKIPPTNMPCGKTLIYLTLDQAKERGHAYSGWYHSEPITSTDHLAVPKEWVS